MRFQLTAVGLALVALLSACGGGNEGRKAQFIGFTNPGTQTLPSVPKDLGVTTSSNLPVAVTSDTPTICTVVDGNLIPIKKGGCLITALQEGNADYLPARVQQAFVIVQGANTITFTSPGDLMIDDMPPELVATSSSGLPVSLTSNTPTICTVSGTTLTLVSGGDCEIVANQDGNNDYVAARKFVNFVIGVPPLTFASGYKAWDEFRSTEDGRVDMYGGAPIPSTFERSVAGDGSTYTWTQIIASATPPDWAYQGFTLYAPGVVDLATDGNTAGGIRLTGQRAIKYSVMMNPEWISANKKAFRVDLYLGHYNKKANGDNCNVRLRKFQDLPFTGPVASVQEQSIALKDFVVDDSCELGTLAVATELANYPISKIEFNVPEVNRSVKTTGTDNYVTSFTLGKVTFQ